METIKFLVQGSAKTPYELIFERDGTQIAAFCTCPAGENGTACKHRLSIFSGLDTGIVSGNAEKVTEIVAWLPGSTLAADMAELDEAERNFERAKTAVAKAKKKLAATMMGR